MSWTNLFLVVCIYLFLPILYVTMRNNTVCKKGLILSVTLPPEAQRDDEVAAYIRRFRTGLFRTFLLLTVALVPALFFPWVSVATTWSLLWMLAAMVVAFRAYGRGYQGLKDLKRRRGWQTPSSQQVVVELTPLKLPKPVKTAWFVPPMVLSVLPVISCLVDPLDPAWRLILVITASMGLSVTAGSLVFHGLIFRQKPDVVDHDPDRTAALTRVRRYNWTKTWLLLSWLTGLYSLAVWIGQGGGYLAITLIYAGILVFVTLATEFAVRRAQQRLNSGAPPVTDEDDHWIWGQFYYNPSSSKVFVPERVGMGMSMNYATTAGKVTAVVCILLLLAMVPLGGWMMAEELTPVRLTVTEDTVTIRQVGVVYQVDLADVTRAELLSELPPSSRIWGTGLEHLLKGRFSAAGYGTMEFCLDPHEPPFLLLETANETYLFGGEGIQELYQRIAED